MKTCINLLPESRKLLMAKKKRFRNIIKQEILFLFSVVLFILMLLGINLILKVQEEGIRIANDISGDQDNYKELKLYEEQTKNINSKVLNIKKFEEKHLLWSGVMENLAALFPDGIVLSDFSTKDFQIFLIGKAENRGFLIELQDRIGKSECFENVNVPLSNLVVRDNIDFQMDFYVKKDCLTKK